MDDRQRIIEILNELVEAERSSFLRRLMASTVFVSSASADEELTVERMAAEIDEHTEWLVDAIDRLNGGVLPWMPDEALTDLHYQELTAVLPRVIENEKRIIAKHERASTLVAGEPIAAQVVGRILSRHRDHVRQFESFLEDRCRDDVIT